MRQTLKDEQIHPTMRDQINTFHADIVAEVAVAVQTNRVAQTSCVKNVDRMAYVSHDFCGSTIDRWKLGPEKTLGGKSDIASLLALR